MRNWKAKALILASIAVLIMAIGITPAGAQVSVHLQNGDKALKEGSWILAVTEFRLALNYEPQNTTAWSGMGRAYEGLSGSKAAYDSMVEGLTGTGSAGAWTPTPEQASNLQEAVKAYTNAINFFPSSKPAISGLGRAYYMSGRTQEALMTLERGASLFQLDNEALANLIYVCLFAKDSQRLAYYVSMAKSSQTTQSDAAIVHALAAVEYASGNYKAAEALLTPLMYRYDVGYLPLKAMGDVLLVQGRPIEALSFYRYAAGMEPKAAGAWLMAADLIAMTGDAQGAAAAYRSALLASPGSSWASFGLARSLADSADLNGALGMLNELAQRPAIEGLDSIFAYKAQVERNLGLLQQAEVSLKSSLALNASNPVATYLLNAVQSEMRAKGTSSLQFNGLQIPPFDGFVINGGAKVTNNRKVTLNVNTSSSYISFKNENSDYSAFSFKFGATASYDWMLSEKDGVKSVQMRTRDGLFSLAKDGPVKQIVLDATAPAAVVREAKYISGNVFLMSMQATDALTGVSSFWLSPDGLSWKFFRWIGSSFPFVYTGSAASRLVNGFAVDGAGNFAQFTADISASVPGPVLSNVSVTETGTGVVTVKWDTDRASDSYVEYRLGQAVNTVGSPVQTRAHSVEISGLVTGQIYTFKPMSTDSYGLKGEGQQVSITVSMPARGPVISGTNALNITTSSATVVWTTDVPAYGYVVYTGGGQQFTSSQVGPTQSAQIALTGLSQITSYQYQIVAWDAAGRQSYSDPRSFTTMSSDRNAPVITTFRASGGITNTSNRNIGLELFASDDSGYVTEMSFRDDASSWGSWQAYGTYASFTISDREGSRTVYARVRDAQGNISAEASFKVNLDRVAPKISWVAAQAGSDRADITWDTDENSDSWVIFGTSQYSLTSTAGQADSTRSHRVTVTGLLSNTTYFYKVMSRDATGNSSESAVSSFRTQAAVQSDTKAPTGSISINDSSQYTRSRFVYLNLYASDDRSSQGELQFRIGEGTSSFNINWGSWQQYTTRVQYQMPAGDGQRNIWVSYRDAAGNISQAYSSSVILDTRAPGITGLQAYNITTTSAVISFNTSELAIGSVEYGTASFSLSLVAGDSGVSSASVSSVEPSSVVITPNPIASKPGTTSFNIQITGLRTGTTYYYRAVAMDLAGNAAASQTMSFTTLAPVPTDTKAPTGSISINDSSQYTRSRYVYLNLYATDDRSSQSEIQFRVGEGLSSFNINWGNWQQYTTRVQYQMSAGDGQRNIWVSYRDAAGNVSQAYVASVILDTRAPGITGLQAYNITTSSAVVGFSTSEPAFASVEYGTSSFSITMVSGEASVSSAAASSVEPSSVIITPNPVASKPGSTSFNIQLSGLRSDTTYYYRAVAMDFAGNVAASQVYSFKTQAPTPTDTTPPTGSIMINDGTRYTRSRYVALTLNASDNVTQQSQLQFRVGEGVNASNVSWGNWQQFASKVTLQVSSGDGQKNIWVMYRDAAGNMSQAYLASITLDTKAPAISNLNASNITQNSVTIKWLTNEPAFGSVEFGSSTASMNSVSGDASVRSAAISSVTPSSVVITPTTVSSKVGNTSFSINVTGLQPNTTYYYRAVVMDPAGNMTASQTQSFRTAAVVVTPPVTPPITPPIVTPPITPPVVIPPIVTPPGQAAVNLAGKSQGAKAETNGFNGGNAAPLANDESASSFWESKNPPADNSTIWLEINFGKTVSLNTVVLKVSNDYMPKNFVVSAVIGGKWVEIAEYKDGKAKGTGNALEVITLTFNQISTSQIRVYFKEMDKKGNRARVYELEAYLK